MKKLILAATVAALAVAGPAQADRPGDDRGTDRAEAGKTDDLGAQSRERGERGRDKARGDDHAGAKRHGRSCEPRRVGYLAHGTYVAGTLTQTMGADTATDPSDDRYSGTVTVMVKKGNRAAKADKGTTKVYTLVDAKVRYADRNDDGTRDQPVAGDRMRVQGKTTMLRKGCDMTGFTPELMVKKVMFGKPVVAPVPAPAPAA